MKFFTCNIIHFLKATTISIVFDIFFLFNNPILKKKNNNALKIWLIKYQITVANVILSIKLL